MSKEKEQKSFGRIAKADNRKNTASGEHGRKMTVFAQKRRCSPENDSIYGFTKSENKNCWTKR